MLSLSGLAYLPNTEVLRQPPHHTTWWQNLVSLLLRMDLPGKSTMATDTIQDQSAPRQESVVTAVPVKYRVHPYSAVFLQYLGVQLFQRTGSLHAKADKEHGHTCTPAATEGRAPAHKHGLPPPAAPVRMGTNGFQGTQPPLLTGDHQLARRLAELRNSRAS